MAKPHLDPKTQLLIGVGSAVAAKCQICFSKIYSRVKDVGATHAEVRAAVEIADQVAANSHEFMLAFVEEATRGEVSVRSEEEPVGGCGCS